MAVTSCQPWAARDFLHLFASEAAMRRAPEPRRASGSMPSSRQMAAVSGRTGMSALSHVGPQAAGVGHLPQRADDAAFRHVVHRGHPRVPGGQGRSHHA